MRRILLMVLRNIFFVPVYWYKLCYHARHVDKYTEEEHYKLLKYIDHRANTSGNIHIEVHGQENIPEQDGFMFYPNHQGLYDVLAIMEACPRPFAVVAKKEVADVPFLKQVFTCMKAYMIDREDVRQSLQVIVNVSNDVKNGRNFLIFPEGTRNKSEDPADLMEFHEGSLKIAEKSGCPVIPVAITGTDDVFERHIPWIRKSHVIIEYGEPIYLKELPLDKKKFPGAYTREIISEMIKKQQQERAGK